MSRINLTDIELLLLDVIRDFYVIGYLFRRMRSDPACEGLRRSFWEGCRIVCEKSRTLEKSLSESDWIPPAFIGRTSCAFTKDLAHKYTLAVSRFGNFGENFPSFVSQFEAVQSALRLDEHIDLDALEQGVSNEMSESRQLALLDRTKLAVIPDIAPTPIESASEPSAPKGNPGRMPDAAKRRHSERTNELRLQVPQMSWKACSETINKEFNLVGADRYTNEKIRSLHRQHYGDKATKKNRG